MAYRDEDRFQRRQNEDDRWYRDDYSARRGYARGRHPGEGSQRGFRDRDLRSEFRRGYGSEGGGGYGGYRRERYGRGLSNPDYERGTLGRYEDYGRNLDRASAYSQYDRGRNRSNMWDYDESDEWSNRGREMFGRYGRDFPESDYDRDYDYDRWSYNELSPSSWHEPSRYQSGRYEGRESHREGEDRGWWDKTSDEIASWFGDEEAARRRRYDKVEAGRHRGVGPKGYQRSDSRIEEDINDALTDNDYLDASEITCSVSNGEVTLSGTVRDRNSKRLAENIAEQISGVRNVENRIRVESATGQNIPITTSEQTAMPSGTASKAQTTKGS